MKQGKARMTVRAADARAGMTHAPVLLGLALLLSACSADPCLSRTGTWPNPTGTRLNLGQCWNHEDLRRFYTTSFGSQLAPYDLVMPLKLVEPDISSPDGWKFLSADFFSRPHIEERWRFLAMEESDWDDQSHVNRDDIKTGWPVGFVIDERTTGKWDWRGEWVGLTCAACHTAQIEVTDKQDPNKKWKLRVAGGPSMADVNRFMQDLRNSLKAVYEDGVRTQNDPKKKNDAGKTNGVKNDTEFDRYARRHEKMFGPEDQQKLLARLRAEVYERDLWYIWNRPPTDRPAGFARLDAFGGIYNDVMRMTDRKPVGASDVDAPVSLPFLWHFSSHNQTQWNGSAPAVPLLVNIAGSLGIFAKYDPSVGWFEDPSTVRLDALRELQALLDRLRSPKWPENILGKPDSSKVTRGREAFKIKCLGCHGEQPREHTLNRANVTMVPADMIQTDSKMVENANRRELKDPNGKSKTKASSALAGATFGIIFSLSHPGETLAFVREALSALLLPKKSILSLGPEEAYKARPLEGIWATAPYLHNGSVPNLYELLSPQAARSKQFCVGSREFDRVRVGFIAPDNKQACEKAGFFWLDTGIDANHNTGHDYQDTPNCKQLEAEHRAENGVVGCLLTIQQREDIIEYLKPL